MDFFGDDIDSMLDDVGGDKLNENLRAEDVNDRDGQDEKNDNDDDDDDKKDDAAPIPVEHKKRTVRRPQLRLNVERLKSERGIQTAENYFKDIKFMGKGHERHDLNNVMKRLEHWAHRLYPNFNFDDFIATCERLGKKKEIQRHMYRYRQGMLEDEAAAKVTEDDNTEDNDREEMEPIDELDEIIDQQIQNYSVAPPKTPRTPGPGHDTTFDSLRSSVIGTPKFMGRQPVEASTPLPYSSDDLGVRPLTDTPGKPNADRPPAAATAPLSSEQMARIAENRRLAQERLKAKRDREAEEQRKKEAAKQMQPIDEEEMEF